ncbi:sensor histidine kinase [Dyadobacter sp.]|uniref:sensor histidine kinase n=1 Tax=Dyadobacter sp. TaxID=1914288 RepID=UPI003F727CAF
METKTDIWTKTGFSTRDKYIFLSACAAGPIWVAMNFFANTLGINGDEAIAAALTAFFLGGVFTGRYLAELATVRIKKPQKLLLGTLSVLVISNIGLMIQFEFSDDSSRAFNVLLGWILFMTISITLGMVVKLLRAIGFNELQEARSQAAHSKSELHLLQSQLSPHFLFNTLNNLYGLSITQHEKIPPLLLKLADLLRYSVYDASEMFVPLKDELAYIENYIDFEKIRIGERLELVTDIEKIGDTQMQIAPMLLIVFVENAFKHSKNTTDEKIYIDISIKTWNGLILFSVKNSRGPAKEEVKIFEKNSGFGLPNVKKRLELLYPNAHELTIKEEPDSYQVILRLNAH